MKHNHYALITFTASKKLKCYGLSHSNHYIHFLCCKSKNIPTAGNKQPFELTLNEAFDKNMPSDTLSSG